MYTGVIFDLDGTLLDTLQDLAAAGNHALASLGQAPYPAQSYQKMVGKGFDTLIAAMLAGRSLPSHQHAVLFSAFRDYYAQHTSDHTLPYPGILPMLVQLKDTGLRLGVLSNKADSFVGPIVQHFFPDTFDAVYGLREAFPPKPAPASLLAMLAELNLAPEQVLYCGDSDVDMHTAGNANITSCGVLWGFRDADELLAAGAQHTAQDAQELLRIIFE